MRHGGHHLGRCLHQPLNGGGQADGAFAQGLTPVRIGYVPVIGASALYVADRAGWAREAGLDLKLVRFDSGPAAIQALSSGTLDMLAIGVAPVAVARARAQAQFARMDLERRRPELYGAKQEVVHRMPEPLQIVVSSPQIAPQHDIPGVVVENEVKQVSDK